MSKKAKKPDIILSISGGIIEVEKRPTNISILVKDYDIIEENSETKNDKDGTKYQPYFYDRR
jgi:hypothetical protein